MNSKEATLLTKFMSKIQKMKATILIVIGIGLVVSCKTHSNLNPLPEDSIEIPPQTSLSYFKAIGTEPFWSLELSETSMKFTALDESMNFNAPHVEPNMAMDANVKMYRAATESGIIEITISNATCSDMMSDTVYSYAVEIRLKKGVTSDYTTLKGCGNYIVDYRLHNIWVLEELEGKNLSKDFFLDDFPFLEINSKLMNFSGFGGCNRIRGNLFQERTLLRFTDVTSSKMMCDTKNKESMFLAALAAATSYEIKNNKLYLSNPDGMKIIMKKID